jgi:hypothetical protein
MLSSQQDSVSLPDLDLTRLAVGVWRLVFAANYCGQKKQIRVVDFERNKTDECTSARRVGGPPGAPIRVLNVHHDLRRK